MLTLKGNHIYLRALEPEDLDFLYQIENNESFWEVSNTTTPYSKFILKQYIENSYKDIYEAKQLRLMICLNGSKKSIGCVDLFDFEPKHKRVGVGIVISSKANTNKGYALESIELIANYAFNHLDLHQLYANITDDNIASITLFKKAKYINAGIKKDWIFSSGKFKNELIYQLINE